MSDASPVSRLTGWLSSTAVSNQTIVISAIALAFFLQPLFWNQLGVYNLGGDDSRLYTYQPLAYATHTGLYSWYGTSFGAYNPQQFMLPFLGLTALLDAVPIANTQDALYGTIFAGSFLTVYKTVRMLLAEVGCEPRTFPPVIAGIFYTTAPIIFIYWNNPLYTSITGVLLFPVLLLTVLSGIARDDWLPLGVGAIAATFFAPGTFVSPNFFSFTLLTAPFVFYWGSVVMSVPKQTVYRSLQFVSLFLVINSFWLFPFADSLSGQFQRVGEASSQASINSMRNIAATQNLYNTFVGIPASWLDPANIYPRILAVVGVVLPLVIVLGLIASMRIRSRSQRLTRLLAGLVGIWLLAMYTYTVNIGPFGTDIFAAMLRDAPLWGMFRSFYRRFHIVYSLFHAITFGVALHALLESLSDNPLPYVQRFTDRHSLIDAELGVVVITLLIVSSMAIPVVSGTVTDRPISTTSDTIRDRNIQPPTYHNQNVETLSKSPSGRVLSLPLLKGNWNFYESSIGDGIYVGISPYRLLGGKQDITGMLDYQQFPNREMGRVMQQAVRERDYSLQRNGYALLNIRYLSYNRRATQVLSPENIGSINSIAGAQTFQADNQQNATITALGPSHLATRGPTRLYQFNRTQTYPRIYASNRVTVYEGSVRSFLSLPAHQQPNKSIYLLNSDSAVDSRLSSDVIIRHEERKRTNSSVSTSPTVQFHKISPVEYRVHVRNVSGRFALTLLDSYHPGWSLYRGHPNLLTRVFGSPVESPHFRANGYSNGWVVAPKSGSSEMTLTVYFRPQRLFIVGSWISLLALFALSYVTLARSRFL